MAYSRATMLSLSICLAVWFVVALSASASGWLARFDASIVMAFGFVLPCAGFPLAYVWSPRVRRFVHARDLRVMTLLEAGRIVGGSAFGWDLSHGRMPVAFTAVTFVTDEIVGFTSFLAAFTFLHRYPRAFVAWHMAGFLVLVVSGTLGILAAPAVGIVGGPATSQPMTQLPFSLVPTFFAPIVQVAHFIALVNTPGRRRA